MRSMNGTILPASASRPASRVPRLALRGIGLAAEVGIALEHHLRVRVVLREHVRAGADRVPVEREVAPVVHAALRVEAVGLHRHRREERHRQPVHELRVLALDADAVGVAVHDLDAGEREAPQVDPGQSLVALPNFASCSFAALVLGLERVRELLQPDDVLAHVAEDRRVHARVREPLDLVDVVVGDELARAGLREVGERELALDLVLGKIEVQRLPAGVDGERGMRLVADAGPDADLVVAVGDRRRRRVRRQLASRCVEQPRLRHLRAPRAGSARRAASGSGTAAAARRSAAMKPYSSEVYDCTGSRCFGRSMNERVEDVLPAVGGRVGIVPGRAPQPASATAASSDGAEKRAPVHGAGV